MSQSAMSDTQKRFDENWQELRADLQECWPLSEEELTMIDGDYQKLIALVHQKTGSSTDEIEAKVRTMVSSHESVMKQVTRSTQQAMEAAQQQVGEPLRQAYGQVQHATQEAPLQSAAIAFGAGLLVGVFAVGLFAFSSPPPRQPNWWEFQR